MAQQNMRGCLKAHATPSSCFNEKDNRASKLVGAWRMLYLSWNVKDIEGGHEVGQDRG